MKKKVLSAVLACAATMALTTCAFADAPATTVGDSEKPGDSDKTIVATVDLGEITAEGLEGDALTAKLFTGEAEGKTWDDVKSITFASTDGTFGVGFKVKAGAVEGNADAVWFQMGKDELAKDDDIPEAEKWTLDEATVKAAVDGGSYLKLSSKDGATVTATVTLKEKAANTGIALAIAPAGLAVAFVTVAAVMSKKKG